jgi:CPA2 family monovalent cation:H+ antiporter-2/glutathione-regulated potassium-efflux system protein KefB
VVVTAVLIALIGNFVGLAWQSALAIGMSLALSSTAIVLQTLNEKNLLDTDAGQSAFSVLLFQDIAVIPMLALFPLLAIAPGGGALAGGHGAEAGGHAEATKWIDGLAGWEQTLIVLAAVLGIVIGGRYLLRPIFRVIAATRLRELFVAAALLLILGVALLMTEVGLSPALGAFVAGVVLANNEYRHELESDIDPFKGLLLAVFFIAVGASVDFQLIRSAPGFIALCVGGLVILKLIVLLGLGRVCRMGLDQNLIFSLALAQGGEFAFVLLSFAAQAGVVTTDVTAPLIAVVAISMALTPVLMLLNERILQPRVGTRERVEREPDDMEDMHEDRPVIIAGFGRFGSTVGRLLRANGIRPTVLEYDSDRVDALRRLGLEVFYGDASRYDLLRAAGADRARLMVIALEEQEHALSVLRSVQKHFPHLTVLVRAIGRPEAYELRDKGVDHVYRETLDTSLRMGVDALRLLGIRAYKAHRSAKTFLRHDEESVRDLGQLRHDRKAYTSAARERIQALEELLLSELEHEQEERDAGWDTESLREEFRT